MKINIECTCCGFTGNDRDFEFYTDNVDNLLHVECKKCKNSRRILESWELRHLESKVNLEEL